MHIHQFYDEGLAHASYALIAGDRAVVVDPGRDPQPYYDYLREKGATLMGIIETHPHADFVSCHLEMARDTGATIYVSAMVKAHYPHQPFDEGDRILLNGVELRAIHTPGHSPDSISVIVRDENGKDHAIFTGDTLFIGDVGRPDLRESAGAMQAKREELARMMYRTTRQKIMPLDPDIIVYPAHGAGSLCGKNMSEERSSTLHQQLEENAALQEMTEDQFVDFLLEGQPFIPAYFGYDVDLNKTGAEGFADSLKAVPRPDGQLLQLYPDTRIVDARDEAVFKKAHYEGAINIMQDDKFETWLGSLLRPSEFFYLVADEASTLEDLIAKTAKIGYESRIRAAFLYRPGLAPLASMEQLNERDFDKNPTAYTIVDIRSIEEFNAGKAFENAINIPLPELPGRVAEIPTDKPIVVHCAGGYRSAAGSSIVAGELGDQARVYDLSEHVKTYLPE